MKLVDLKVEEMQPLLVLHTVRFSRYIDPFKGFIHRGSEFKKKKHMNPHPKNLGKIPYRDLNHQNEWLWENIFDATSNYLYCFSCAKAALEASKQRIAHQRCI